MLTVRQALEQLASRFEALPAESVPLQAAVGCVLAEDVAARGDLPAFDHSAMDGYAVRHAELAAGAVLPVCG
ncbi:MAG TPA: molybdopterin molybdenumtransferase MoeA, partial [Polyangiales bacterium]|nr:molybdopterin molybdenumtransferase MoeA [Polyangiales bacterium]